MNNVIVIPEIMKYKSQMDAHAPVLFQYRAHSSLIGMVRWNAMPQVPPLVGT